MVLHLNDTITVRQLKNQFSTTYPYLKLIFLHPGQGKAPGGKFRQLLMETRLRDFAKAHSFYPLEIHSWNTIADVENLFKSRFGLAVAVHVLQNSDGHWIEPEAAAFLTLKEQNEKGFKAADHILHPDYDSRIEDGEY